MPLLDPFFKNKNDMQLQLMQMKHPAPECAAWWEATRLWTTALHFFEFAPVAHVRALLRKGAKVRAGIRGGPTPLSLAFSRPSDERAQVIVAAASPWSPATHSRFPAATRAHAVELLLLGHFVARKSGLVPEGAEGALLDAWQARVMPRAVRWQLLAEPRELEPPVRVRVRRLASRPELNGMLGLAIRWDAAAGRYGVRLDGNDACVALLASRVEREREPLA